MLYGDGSGTARIPTPHGIRQAICKNKTQQKGKNNSSEEKDVGRRVVGR